MSFYKSIQETNNGYSIFCLYPADAGSDERFLNCGFRKIDITYGIKNISDPSIILKGKALEDYDSAVQSAYGAKKSVNLCTVLGVTDLPTFLDYKQRVLAPYYAPCPLSGSKSDFDLFMEVSRKHPDREWNEFILRYEEGKYPDIVAAIYYLSSETDNYYTVPEGAIKKYNVHLGLDQQYQKNVSVFKPIIEIDMDKVKDGEAPFIYNPEDQVMNVGDFPSTP